MRVTRGKRDITIGVQPVVIEVKHDGNDTCILSENPKMRGDMTNLKKMIVSNMKVKMKSVISAGLSQGYYVTYAGVDALNMHFSGIPIHTPFVEMCLVEKSEHKHDLNLCVQTAIQDIFITTMNETLESLSNDETCVVTAEILSNWKVSNPYFVLRKCSEDRFLIDFNSSPPQPFVEIRVLPNLKLTPFERDGIYYIPFGSVASEINLTLSNSPNVDWRYRHDCLQELCSKSNTSLSLFAFNSMMRLCFPYITMMKMGSKDAALNLLEEAFRNANNACRDEFLADLEGSREHTMKILTFDNFLRRARLLGLLPDVNRKYGDIMNNVCNRTKFDEFKATTDIK